MRADQKTYLDFNSGAPLHPRVREELLKCFQGSEFLFSNPSSQHSFGQDTKKWIRSARERVAKSLGARVDADALVFTGSESEANQTIVRSELEWAKAQGKSFHWMLSGIEHSSLFETIDYVRDQGGRVTVIAVDSQGRLDWKQVRAEVDATDASANLLLSTVWVNNETGVIQQWPEALADLRANRGLKLHVDGAQAWGRISVDLDREPFDFATFSAHKIGGFSGVGVLFARDAVRLKPLVFGSQQSKRRGGTENVVGILACGFAAGAIDVERFQMATSSLQRHLESRLMSEVEGCVLHASDAKRVSNTTHFRVSGFRSSQLLPALDLEGFAVSAGSACQSGLPKPSRVLMAMGVSENEALGALRVSTGLSSTVLEIDRFVEALKRVLKRLGREPK